MKKQILNPENFTEIIGSYSHGIKVDIRRFRNDFCDWINCYG